MNRWRADTRLCCRGYRSTAALPGRSAVADLLGQFLLECVLGGVALALILAACARRGLAVVALLCLGVQALCAPRHCRQAEARRWRLPHPAGARILSLNVWGAANNCRISVIDPCDAESPRHRR